MVSSKQTIYWFRRDLRIIDNRGFHHACLNHENIMPIFIFDPNILDKIKSKQDRRVQFLWESLMDLKAALEDKGGKLFIFFGKPENIINNLVQENNIEAVVCNEDYEPYAIKRDDKVKLNLAKLDIEFKSFKDQVVFRGDEVLKKDGTPYRVFTPYKRVWLAKLSKDDLAKHMIKSFSFAKNNKYKHELVSSLSDIGFENTNNLYKGGRKEAKKLVLKFTPKIHNYKNDRDFIFKDANSHISPHLRFGTISIRELVRQSLKTSSDGAQVWLSELVWREFYQMILFQFPSVVKGAFNKKYNDIVWQGDLKHFKLWKEAKTGFPIIDAAMKYFAETGLMHNRLRMVIASFLTKDLLIDWKKGEEYFAQKLFDFDLASNNGGWQWSASTGCDAQPYFRVFNPYSQSERFDKEGEFILSQFPVLKGFPRKYIHAPHLASLKIQQEANCIVGKDYPKPIVDHAVQRLIAIDMFKK